jgi:cell wall integrity and stress response component
VVVGVLAAVALVGGSILFYKRRRQQKVEEEYRRTLAVQSFGKKPEADHRLEPVMLQRRASDGSIADNEDYSRRILKVDFHAQFLRSTLIFYTGHQPRRLRMRHPGGSTR